jgi:uncharacterized protein
MVAPGSKLQHIQIPAIQLAELCQRFKVRELSIFGSVLRDDFRSDSDVDVLIEMEPAESMTIEKFLAIQDALEALIQRPIDLVEKKLVNNPYRREEILRTREILYAA